MTAVAVEGLAVRFGAVEVLRDVSLSIGDGEFFFLLGPSGCGKTTLLRALAGFVEPVGGRILFDGRPVQGVPPARRDTGLVFQNYALWPHLTVAQNVAFGLEVRKVPPAERARRVREALALVRMEHLADRAPNRLSGGQQQRVALARALVVEPAVLLLDEPLSNLDAALRVELRAEIREIQRRTRRTAVYVTHDRAEALALADRIAVLRDGRVEQLGTPEDLYDRPASPFVAGFVGDCNRLDGEAAAAGPGQVLVGGPWGAVLARTPGRAAPAPGAAARLLLRPERLRLLPSGLPATGRLAGRVLRRTFLGEFVQVDVELPGQAVVRVLLLGGERAVRQGDAVCVGVDDALAWPGDAG